VNELENIFFYGIKNLKKFSGNSFNNYICLKIPPMAEAKNTEETQPVGIWWLMFIISAIVQVIFLIWIREYFWMVLPWWITSLGKAMRLI